MSYCPQQYDIVWLQFDPQVSREQAGRRPAFVLSTGRYNEIARLCVLCPITSQIKGYPFEVMLPSGLKTKGAVLADQIKSMAWSERNAELIENCAAIAPAIHNRIKAVLTL